MALSSATFDALQHEVSMLRQVVKHLLDSIQSLEAWRGEVAAQLEQRDKCLTSGKDDPATPEEGRACGTTCGAIEALPLDAHSIQAAMEHEVHAVTLRIAAAKRREDTLRARYEALLQSR